MEQLQEVSKDGLVHLEVIACRLVNMLKVNVIVDVWGQRSEWPAQLEMVERQQEWK